MNKDFTKRRHYVVFSASVCDYLLEHGQELIQTRPDAKEPDRVVFVFKNRPETHGLVLEAQKQIELMKKG